MLQVRAASKLSFISILLLLVSSLVSAQQSDEINIKELNSNFFYLGAKAGWMHYQNACEEWNIGCDGDDKAYGLFAGYQFSEHFALETAYLDLGEASAIYSESGLNNRYIGSMKGVEISLLGRLPLSEDFDLFAKAGTFRWDGENKGPVSTKSDSDWSPMAGVGLEYNLTPSWTARVEYQYIDKLGSEFIGGSNGHLTSIGLTYRFGQSGASKPVVQEKVTLPAKIEPVIAPVQLLPEISIKLLFEFDSSKLNDPDALLPVIARLKTDPNSIALIKGFTDSKGASAYNQSLSERRVQSVVDYLSANGVKAEQLELHAYGESFPEVDNNTEGHRHTNRRVSIYISSSTIETE
ncbi:outer membrane beta-barrel protein [Shewanella nanhaiensis]|uniref:Outer membrane beta-barrel protein n=1 Tax=Shewanella nanhaiensis TaxID=2864872 RepID=A0ABS7E1I1_9GAMM|nr:outer membrane beta-barrel protein [Shewanella nanhaiensis]MBW8183498.1 outer membrane beta-barrel protein [Shewanella nanhaiensis]